MHSKLQYISQGTTGKQQLKNIQNVLDAGCRWIQLRHKYGGKKELHNLAERVKKLCIGYSSVFIMNDHADIAMAVDADGVHLGLSDMPVTKARKIIGADKIIGGTANTLQDIIRRIEENCSYIGLGPFRFTPTKEKLSPVLGLEGLSRIMKEILSLDNNIPVYAIGGITQGDIPAIMKTGVAGVAVSGDITICINKTDWIRKFNILTDEQLNNRR